MLQAVTNLFNKELKLKDFANVIRENPKENMPKEKPGISVSIT